MTDLIMRRTALLSDCGRYRYSLGRQWHEAAPCLNWIMLNPSTADAHRDDPTIRKCIGFAHRLGYGGIRVLNLFAFRATSPDDMKAADDPVGPQNDTTLRSLAAGEMAIAAWGAHGAFGGRHRAVAELLSAAGARLHALRLTKEGHPGHPLYIPYSVEPFAWSPS